jgi:hypothetical protein
MHLLKNVLMQKVIRMQMHPTWQYQAKVIRIANIARSKQII